MDPRTRRHLVRARRNSQVALALLNQPATSGVSPPPFEWATVVAFYAAVHYVNAFLWEKLRHEPRDHSARLQMVTMALRSIYSAYHKLADLGWRARYVPEFQLSGADARSAIEGDLAQIEREVLAALGNPAF